MSSAHSSELGRYELSLGDSSRQHKAWFSLSFLFSLRMAYAAVSGSSLLYSPDRPRTDF